MILIVNQYKILILERRMACRNGVCSTGGNKMGARFNRFRQGKFAQGLKKGLPIIGGVAGGAAAAATGNPALIPMGIGAGSALGGGVQQALNQPGGPGAGNALSGSPATEGRFINSDIYNQQQKDLMAALGPWGLQQLQQEGNNQPLEELLSNIMGRNAQSGFNFEPFRQKAMQNFQENTLPGIFERFTSLGKGAQSSGAFQGMLARGGSDLNLGLAGMEQDYMLKHRPYDLQYQDLVQRLLGNQQSYGLDKQRLGLNALESSFKPQYNTGYMPGQSAQPSMAQTMAPQVMDSVFNLFNQWATNKWGAQGQPAQSMQANQVAPNYIQTNNVV
jgi:hypothetical protein